VRPDTKEKLNKIKRISTLLRSVCTGLLTLTVLLFATAAICVLAGGNVTIAFIDARIPVAPLALRSRLVLVGILAISMGVMAKGLYHLYKLFGNYSRGDIFTTQAASQIRQLGITAILWSCVNIIRAFALSNITNTPLSMPYQLRLDSVVIGVVIILVSWFMDAAAELREENDLTI
jgi:hypothetical protein